MSTNVPQTPRVLQLVFLTSLSSFYAKYEVIKIQTEVPFCNKSAEHLPEYPLIFQRPSESMLVK